jgi:hypothetical protein
MSSVAYLPNTSPKNNSTAQIRRRANQVVSAVADQSQQIATLQTPAPVSPPIPTQTAITATGGSAVALPTNPAAYEIVEINGVKYKRPLYFL